MITRTYEKRLSGNQAFIRIIPTLFFEKLMEYLSEFISPYIYVNSRVLIQVLINVNLQYDKFYHPPAT